MEKRYYWLKLHPDFFKSLEIKMLRKVAGGDTYTIIYLKILLKVLPDNGVLAYEGIGQTLDDELAEHLGENIENVRITLAYLFEKGLIEEINEAEFYLCQIPELCGSETDGARRVRKHRQAEKQLNFNNPLLQSNDEALLCNEGVTTCNKSANTEKEKEKEKEIEKENKDILVGQARLDIPGIDNSCDVLDKESYAIEQVINHLNARTGSKYKASSKSTRGHIRARLAEGYAVEDFMTVIDKKCVEWTGTEWEKFLRPETLFTPAHFESYLNQRGSPRQRSTGDVLTLIGEKGLEGGPRDDRDYRETGGTAIELYQGGIPERIPGPDGE